MGSGIAQVAAQAGHEVVLSDQSDAALQKSAAQLKETLQKLIQKGKLRNEDAVIIENRISRTTKLTEMADCGLIIEAIVENMEVKKSLFSELDTIVSG